jgi:hypothetical protein
MTITEIHSDDGHQTIYTENNAPGTGANAEVEATSAVRRSALDIIVKVKVTKRTAIGFVSNVVLLD